MQYVGVGRRFVALVIDVVILMVVGWVIALATGGTTEGGFSLEGAPALLLFLVGALYYIILEKMAGATVGKMALGIKVVKPDGSPISWSDSIVRNVLRIVDGLFGYLVGAILVWQSPTRQRLGDRVANTMVVRKAAELKTA